ncbi:hypothetical protein ACFXGT_25170 [Streptomyces sp. NPDC059352]|uniref:hypothetical protein n=1 Tax=Streptomyces sp. NPDC059352 TaxID=3346810 RepID=UPI0036B42C29
MSLEWDGFRLSLGREGLAFTWAGGGFFEAGVAGCVSASLRHPKEAGEGHRLVFRFRFPGIAAGTESVVIRADVPVGKVEQAQRLVGVLWRDYGVPDEADAEAEAKAETDAVTGTARAPATVTVTDGHTGPGPGTGIGIGIGIGIDTGIDTDTGIHAGAGTVPEAASVEAELERTPNAPGWIVSPAGPGSRELFRAVMERPANSDH